MYVILFFQVRQSSELVFIDASSNMDEHNLRIFLIVTHSVAGALPLGMLVTSDEQTETLEKAFELYKGILPERAFFGNAKRGPDVFMTDNCSELRDTLHEAFPNSKLLLCSFHILQQVWRWLFDKNHGVNSYDRVTIMTLFKDILNATDETQFDEKVDAFLESDVLEKYHSAGTYFTDLMAYKESWAKCYRRDQMLRGCHTNNYVEAQFLVLKDTILKRQRQFNINKLLDKIFNDLEEHFKTKLISVADGTYDGIYSRR